METRQIALLLYPCRIIWGQVVGLMSPDVYLFLSFYVYLAFYFIKCVFVIFFACFCIFIVIVFSFAVNNTYLLINQALCCPQKYQLHLSRRKYSFLFIIQNKTFNPESCSWNTNFVAFGDKNIKSYVVNLFQMVM